MHAHPAELTSIRNRQARAPHLHSKFPQGRLACLAAAEQVVRLRRQGKGVVYRHAPQCLRESTFDCGVVPFEGSQRDRPRSQVLGVEPLQRRAPHPAQAAERLTRPLPEILWRLAIEQSPFGSRIDELIAEKPLGWEAIAKALQIAG